MLPLHHIPTNFSCYSKFEYLVIISSSILCAIDERGKIYKIFPILVFSRLFFYCAWCSSRSSCTLCTQVLLSFLGSCHFPLRAKRTVGKLSAPSSSKDILIFYIKIVKKSNVSPGLEIGGSFDPPPGRMTGRTQPKPYRHHTMKPHLEVTTNE